MIVLKDEKGNIQAFMGIEGQKLDMLFVSSKEQNKGFGKKLICYGINNYSINEVCVNEQNPIAKRFYEYMGFRVYKRSDIDEQGNPYPILYFIYEISINQRSNQIFKFKGAKKRRFKFSYL
ncbi:GNAT family N-acetyltransferase [Campylobacter fetus]|uniref:GNAT family N-acetyltransferase n=1 Tax=Campylobacter fetus TaxID=196 RepID=UPI000AABD186|nr:GNAT family N-acetyltransferase [Campylobacter fetus]WNY77671.1 GNAT family N-acetyltransferase [Campylobacter fetus subsp. fetus]WNY79433.1 GNAT family N-acetyltransferase [Campylobacter fetus subsp. fetus]